jgi:hypothetical protein
MQEAAGLPLAAWESFYVIVGSSAAALTGLQFVVIVLGAEMNALGDATTRAFGTPTIVHFCGVLLISAIISAPWHSIPSAAVCLSVCGVAGFAYAIMVVRHARRQKAYTPVFEDWLWHGVLPLVAHAVLIAAAISLPRWPTSSLFAVGATALLLLFVGIHNAWDAVIYIAVTRRQKPEPAGDPNDLGD